MFRRPLLVRGGLLIVAGICMVALGLSALPSSREQSQPVRGDDRDANADGIPRVQFTDITAQAGIGFVHENGARGEKLLPETMGGGCAFLDFDADGDQDLLFVNSRPWPEDSKSSSRELPTMVLYRNNGGGRFDDVTAGSGLDVLLYGMGVAVGDYDNDGRVDVFLSAVGKNRLFHNEGNGRFVDVTDAARVAGDPQEWSTGCGWFDYDNDGDLDLFVCNYVKWSRELDAAENFRLPGGRPAYGRPQDFEGTFPYLYRNDGGTFTDVSVKSGIQVRDATGAPLAKSLGVTFNDFDNDGRLDIVVANDTVQNQFFHNRGNGTFEEKGTLAGIAFDASGNARGAMGVDSAHFRNDNALGVAIGNFSNEMSALYVSYGNDVQFADEAVRAGLGHATRRELAFGVCYIDYDLDGRLDVFAANGHLEPEISSVLPDQQYAQPPQLFWNSGAERRSEFLLVPEDNCGTDFVRPIVGRGASFADIDGDGDLDLLIATVGQAPRLLRNDQQLGHHWLRLKLIGKSCNRNAIGARVEVQLEDRTLRRHVMPTRSYLSQVELPLTIGLGSEDRVLSVTISWPDGSQQKLGSLEVDRTYEIEQRLEPASESSAEVTGRQSSRQRETTPAERQKVDPDRESAVVEFGSTCGAHVHRGVVRQHADDTLPQPHSTPQPCRGPTCSNAPDGPHAPPPPPTRLVQHSSDVLFCADDRPGCCQPSPCFPPDSRVKGAWFTHRIFRPPRCC